MPLPTLTGRQRQVVALPASGHVVVLGTAGSGKSTMAVHRAYFLADPETEHGGQTLLVTFNQSLVKYLRSLVDGTSRNVVVETFHKFATGYLSSKDLIGPNSILTPGRRASIVSKITVNMKDILRVNTGEALSMQFIANELEWIDQHGFTEVNAYVWALEEREELAGDPRHLAQIMLQVRSEYRKLRSETGYLYDWTDIATVVKETLVADTEPRRYRHVVIDEGQDFSPEMIRSLAELIPEDGSLTFFGDAAQQIYGSRVSWRSAGLLTSDEAIWYFRENYRNTNQIARLALAISETPYFHDLADLVEPVAPPAQGALPALIRFKTKEEELAFVSQHATRLGDTQSVAILTLNREEEEQLGAQLPKGATKIHRSMQRWSAEAGIYYGTIYSSKGLEFDTVILSRVSRDEFPDQPIIDSFGIDEAMVRTSRLLYVGVTRAKTGLVITCLGEPSELLPPNNGLYLERAR